MPRSPSSDTSTNAAHKAADKQTTITSYFVSHGDGPKRKRRNLEVLSGDPGNAEELVTSSAENVADEEGKRQCMDDDRSGGFEPSSRLNEERLRVQCSQSSLCSAQQLDPDSCDVIPPSPTAASRSRLKTTCSGTESRPRRPVTGLADISASAADKSSTDALSDAGTSSTSLLMAEGFAEESSDEVIAKQPVKTEDVDSCFGPHQQASHVSDTDDDVDVTDSEILSLDIPSPLSNEVKLLVTETDIDDHSEDAPSLPLQTGRHSTRHRFMEKSNKWKNVEFYLNKIESSPRGGKIEEILLHWKGDYEKLERHHGYIQWLFPIPESGMNYEAQPLTDKEAEFMSTNKIVQDRMVRAYRMMLDFFGLDLKDEATGQLQRARNWHDRMVHLNRSLHNYLRITRMLKCFGVTGLAHLQAPFVKFLIVEAFHTRVIANSQRSCRLYWLPAVVDDRERQQLEQLMRKISQQ